MLTFFTTAKPFVGHIDVIQRNAIRSWQKLHPDVEIILMGDDAGAAEVCAEIGIAAYSPRCGGISTGRNIWRIFMSGRRRRRDMSWCVM